MWAYNEPFSPLYDTMHCNSADDPAWPLVMGALMTLLPVLERFKQVLGPINIGNWHWIGVKMSYTTAGRIVVFHPYDSGRNPTTVTAMPKEFLAAEAVHQADGLNWEAGTEIPIRYQGKSTVDCGLAVFAVWMAHLEIALRGEDDVEELMAQCYSGDKPYRMLHPVPLFLLFAFEDYCTANPYGFAAA